MIYFTRKGVQPSDAYSQFWLPPSDLTPNKQEQFTPIGREPSELLALGENILAVFELRETRAESSSFQKVTNGNCDALFRCCY